MVCISQRLSSTKYCVYLILIYKTFRMTSYDGHPGFSRFITGSPDTYVYYTSPSPTSSCYKNENTAIDAYIYLNGQYPHGDNKYDRIMHAKSDETSTVFPRLCGF